MGDSQKRERFGRYLILDHLVDGGMAKICRARFLGEQADKVVAIKMVQPQYSKDENFKAMFMQEIKVTFGLLHPNVIQTYDYGLNKGQLFVAMEYCDGRNLKEYLEKLRERKFVFPIEISTYIISQVCQGLHYAHTFRDKLTGQAANIIHRDISPHNIMLTYDGSVKIIDFGIAKSKTNSEATQAGTIKGKLSYLAPEYLEGLELDARYDQFAVGITLWELLCSKKLFKENNDLAVLKKIQDCNIPVPSSINPQIPKELDDIVLKALSKDRSNRYEDLDKMNRALMKFLYSKYPDFNSTDLSYFAQELFRDEIKKDREKMYEFGKIDLKPYLEDLKRDAEGGSRSSDENEVAEEEVPRAREQVLDFGFDGLEDKDTKGLSISKPSAGAKTLAGASKDKPALKTKATVTPGSSKVEATPVGAKPASVAKVQAKPAAVKEQKEEKADSALEELVENPESSAVKPVAKKAITKESSAPTRASAVTGSGSSDNLKVGTNKPVKKKSESTNTGTRTRISKEDKEDKKKASLGAVAAAIVMVIGIVAYAFNSLSTPEHVAVQDAPGIKKDYKKRVPAQSGGEPEMGEIHILNSEHKWSYFVNNKKVDTEIGSTIRHPVGDRLTLRVEVEGKEPYVETFSLVSTAPKEVTVPIEKLRSIVLVPISTSNCEEGEYRFKIAGEERVEMMGGNSSNKYINYPVIFNDRTRAPELPIEEFAVDFKNVMKGTTITKKVKITNDNINTTIELCEIINSKDHN